MRLIFNISATCYFLLFLPFPIFATADYDREQRLASEVIDSIIDGEPKWLKQGKRKFLTIITKAEVSENSKSKGNVLVLHGRGYHPNWQDFVYPVRTKLAEQGFNTLSIQLPVLEKNSTYYDYYPTFPEATARIDTALDYLRNNFAGKIVVIAHSCGFHMFNFWLSRNLHPAVDGFIGVGMGPIDAGQQMRQPFMLKRLRGVPILDIYAEFDYPTALRFADVRKSQFTHSYSKQIIIKDAYHYFSKQGDALIGEISTWLAGLN